MFMGEKAPRFTLGAYSFAEAAGVYYIQTKYEHISSDIERRAPIVRKNKHVSIGTYLRYGYRFYNKTLAEITALKALRAKSIKFEPHSDYNIAFEVLVEEVREEMEDGLASRYTVEITVRSRYFVELDTGITVLTPNASSRVIYNYNESTYNITWESNHFASTENVKIELYKAGVFHSLIVSSTQNDGSYAWEMASDQTLGTDWQIKISGLSDRYKYLYAYSSQFEIIPAGYALFDGDNDQVQVPFGPGGKKQRTFAFTYYGASKNEAYNMGLFTSYNSGVTYERFYISGTNISYNRRYSTVGNDTSSYNASDVITREAWQTIVLVLDIEQAVADDRVRIWIDGSEITLTVSVADSGTVNNTANYQLGVYLTNANFKGKMKNVVMTETAWTQTDVDNYQNRVFGTTKALYRMNDADPGSPYTGGTVDSSGNGNHATPVGVDATFFNQYPYTGIAVLTPNASSQWVHNYEDDYSFDITWTSKHLAAVENVKIDLYKSGIYHSAVVASTPNDGSYSWIINAVTVQTGTDYSIRISGISDRYKYLYGDSAVFQILHEYWMDENGDFVTDENGDRIPMN